MSGTAPELIGLIEQWLDEFSRSIEMFTGKHVELSATPLASLPPSPAALVWRAQKFHVRNAEFSIWTGAPNSTFAALSSADATDSAESYTDIVSQANQGFAVVIGNGYGIDVRCGDQSTDGPSAASPLNWFSLGTRVEGVESASFLVAISSEILALLAPPVKQLPAGAGGVSDAGGSEPRPPMLERLMDLELPLSVSLGRATLPIREVLKLTSGSLVELDRTSTDYVDLVVHGTVVARGEVVSVKGNYGVRVREIISREDRMALHARA